MSQPSGVPVFLIALMAGCPAPEGDGETGAETTSSSSTAMPTDDGSSTSTSAGSGDAESSTSSTAESANGTTEIGSTTGEPVPTPEECAALTTEQECLALGKYCMWQPVYEVLDEETCELSEAGYSCWGQDLSPDPGGCLGLFPQACIDQDVQPLYRELDGVLFLLDLQAACNDRPVVPEGEPRWEACESDKFEPQPSFCYCLCGGPPE